jgi:hypothetical protein
VAEIALQAQIQGLRSAVDSQLFADEPAARPELPWRPGERVTAVVEALRGERTLLRAGNFLFDVKLPPGRLPGQRLDLVFVAATPRATFALAEPAEAVPPRAPVDISPAARSLTALVRTVAPERPPQPTPVSDSQPLLPAAPRDAAVLAAALQRSLATSGLFYESHLAQWVAGERSLAALRDEPQARVPAAPTSASTPTSARSHGAQASAAAEAPDLPETPAAPVAARPTITAGAPADTVDQRVAAQVRAQIESLDARQILWQGQAWPGQPLEWRVDEPPQDPAHSEAPPSWTSHLRLVLPHLGEITADLALTGDTLRVRLTAQEATTRAALAAAQPMLGDALEQGRIHLTAFSVHE